MASNYNPFKEPVHLIEIQYGDECIEDDIERIEIIINFFYIIILYTILIYIGWMAEWLCSGLQSRLRRFDSGFSLHYISHTFLLSSYSFESKYI